MKLKQLESLLGGLQQFSNPKCRWSWNSTLLDLTSPLACSTLYRSFDASFFLTFFHFPCAAAALLGAEQVIGIDIDSQSLEIASMNAEDLELEIDFIQCDISNLGWRGQIVDTVVMNPPFGTRKKGADMDFLFVALKVASQAVYSLHKTSTRDHVKRAALRDLNASSAEVLCELRFDVPQLYKFHKKKEVDIAVDLWRFVPKRSRGKDI
ncbi:methyltransferase-like protein 5 isoform X2 [Herrania umbratica]|uniref:Methyltransferase-like protein 5 isoform X2 n=1 Tax=Herrania umbratica TaxID=108875 RepID=A0A6J0ZRX7_9ROSI|nr:methyltransferase-like protein 5 isoform X2 [Herrania umbratica]